MAITITKEFRDALDLINRGHNVLITGKAGTGKSTLLRTFLEGQEEKNVLVTAPTGVAALNIGGFTIHKAFRFRPGMFPDDIKPEGAWKPTAEISKIMKTLDILVIDEISMVRADLFDMMDAALKRLRNNQLSFGGVQLVLVGDLLQLPPVVTDHEAKIFSENWNSPYFFSAHCYDQVKLNSINLTTVWRQTDEEFIEILNQAREGSLSSAALNRLNVQVDASFDVPHDWVTLASRRVIVDQINHARLESLDTAKFLSIAEYYGEADEKSFSASNELHYAVGARVMTVINDSDHRFVNGSFGTIVGATEASITITLDHNDETIELGKHIWEIKRPVYTDSGLSSEVIGSVSQFPVILAWAITIHKSQGKTIPKLFINLKGGTTTEGQFYVALSRGVSLENIRFSAPVEDRHVRANNTLVRRIRRDVGPAITTNRVTFLSIDGVNFGISDHVIRIHAVILEGNQKVADFGTWINPMSDLGSFGERHKVPSGGLAMAPTLSDFWPLLLRQAEGSIIIGDNLPMLERAVRHQEKGMDLALGTGYDVSEFEVKLTGDDVISRAYAMVAAYLEKPFAISHGQEVPAAPQLTEGSVFIPSWAPTSPMQLDPTHATDSDHAWAAYSGGPARNLVPEEVAETADLLSAWAVSRGYWTEAEATDIRTRAAHAGMSDLILPEVESNNLDIPSLLAPGTRVAFTGRNNLLGGPADDDRLRGICESVNLEYKTAVSKTRCDVLIAHDPASQSRKAQNAREFGKPIITQNDFEHWYNHGPFLTEPASTTESSKPSPVVASSPQPHVEEVIPEPTVQDTPERDVNAYTWVTPEEIFEQGTRVAFRGSTYVDGVLLPQGEPLQGLCSLLGIEYKQAVTKTRCDVLVTDDPTATDGKMKMARIHNKPLIRQEDFDAWAKQKLTELECDTPAESLDEDEEEIIIPSKVQNSRTEPSVNPVSVEPVSDELEGLEPDFSGVWDEESTPESTIPTPESSPYRAEEQPISRPAAFAQPAPKPVRTNDDANTFSYADYIASSSPQPVPAVQRAQPEKASPKRPKMKKALIGTGISALTSVVLFFVMVYLILMEYSDDVAIPVFIASFLTGIVSIGFGIAAIVNWILKR